MGKLKIGAFLTSFALPFKAAVAKCKELELDVVEFSDIDDITLFKPLSETQVTTIKDVFSSNNIAISSVCAEVGGFAIADSELCKQRVASVKNVIDNAVKLGVKIIQFHIGAISFAEDDARFIKEAGEEKNTLGNPKENLVNSLKDLDEYATKAGVRLATETGPEDGAGLCAFIKGNNFKSVYVNFDPANLCMNNFDEVQSVYDLKGLIIQTHAKDGIRNSAKDGYKEVPLGEGDVRWDLYLKALKEIGFEGNFIIERECGAEPAKDIEMAAEFLKKQ